MESLTRNSFYEAIVDAAGKRPEARRTALINLHDRVLFAYLVSLERVDDSAAARTIPGDGRTVAQVVGHILEWDRAVLISLGEILAGVRWPRIMSASTNIDADGTQHDFGTVDAFNAHYAQAQAGLPWEGLRDAATAVAKDLRAFLKAPHLLTASRLEETQIFKDYRLPEGQTLAMPCGWYLWMVTLEHEGVEHLAELSAEGSE